MRQDDIIHRPADYLTELSRRVLALNAENAYTKLVVAERAASDAITTMLSSAEPTALVSAKVVDIEAAKGLLAGLYLWHDHLAQSHTISQSIPTPTGSLWHAIMHRREGDFSNSKYWYARCTNHPCSQFLAAQVAQLIASLPADKQLLRLTQAGWNPNAFVDFVEQLHDRPSDPKYSLAVELQKMEWRCLFDWSVRQSIGR